MYIKPDSKYFKKCFSLRYFKEGRMAVTTQAKIFDNYCRFEMLSK